MDSTGSGGWDFEGAIACETQKEGDKDGTRLMLTPPTNVSRKSTRHQRSHFQKETNNFWDGCAADELLLTPKATPVYAGVSRGL